MVFEGINTLNGVTFLDPHFIKPGRKYEPIARFPGDEKGAKLAEKFVQGLLNAN